MSSRLMPNYRSLGPYIYIRLNGPPWEVVRSRSSPGVRPKFTALQTNFTAEVCELRRSCVYKPQPSFTQVCCTRYHYTVDVNLCALEV